METIHPNRPTHKQAIAQIARREHLSTHSARKMFDNVVTNGSSTVTRIRCDSRSITSMEDIVRDLLVLRSSV